MRLDVLIPKAKVAKSAIFLEMASTGEVASFGKDIYEAYWASLLSTTGFKIPKAGSGVLIGGDIEKPEMTSIAKRLIELGFKLYCSSPLVEEFLNSIPHVSAKRIWFPKTDKRKLREVFDEFDILCVVNLARSRGANLLDEDYVARRQVLLSVNSHSSAPPNFFFFTPPQGMLSTLDYRC